MLEEIKPKMIVQKFNLFIKQLQVALDQIDEANEISLFRYRKFPLKENNIYFAL